MSISIYHQCGHNTNWNIESFSDDKCGDGLILSPVHQQMSKIEHLDEEIKERSLFDPQYYLPNSQKSKLKSYPFFPETISDGFSTRDFVLVSLMSAQQCIDFQMAQDFEKIIIPARYFDQLDPDYTDKQEEYTVRPFLNAITEAKVKKPIFLTLPLTSHMIENKTYQTKILNWVTSFPEINGIYAIAALERDTKQIQSKSFLISYMDFLTDLRNADLQIIIGYSNTESLLYSLIDDCILSFGTFENTRLFSVDKFVVMDEERRGPKARIYIPKLLNWIQFDQAKQIMVDAPEIWGEIYQPTEYGDRALKAATEPTFNQPGLYKHHFICFYEQINELKKLGVVNRYNKLRTWIKEAIELYDRIKEIPIDLEKHGDDRHLQPWLDCINHYFKKYLKT